LFRISPGKPATERALVWIHRVLAFVGALTILVTVTPVVSWWATWLAGPWNDPAGNVLIVLGGASDSHGILGESAYLRCEYAIIAYRKGDFEKIVLSGGGAPVPVATAMKRFMVGEGIPPHVILTETRSTSTRENALYTKALVESLPGKKVLMTSDFHMFRAYRVFRKAGLCVLPRPIPDVRKHASRWTGRWGSFLELSRETVKIIYYYARGWI
jgi:uncharacterized SAM-binding protein YcdF (DUF218 family)